MWAALMPLFLQAENLLIITHAFNDNFIALQKKSLALLKDKHEFVVFNDANTNAMAKKVEQACKKANVRCIRVPQEIHDRPYLERLPDENFHRPNIRHVNCCKYSLDVLGYDFDGIVGFLDSDMFFIRPISILEEMVGYDFMAVGRGGANKGVTIGYLWPGLCFMRMNKLPDKYTLDFNCGYIKGVSVDSGGYSYYYLTTHPQVKRKGVDEVWGYQLHCPDRFVPSNMLKLRASRKDCIATFKSLGFNKREMAFLMQKPDTIQFLLKNSILHYRAGTNYDGRSAQYNDGKRKMIEDFVSEVLRQERKK